MFHSSVQTKEMSLSLIQHEVVLVHNLLDEKPLRNEYFLNLTLTKSLLSCIDDLFFNSMYFRLKISVDQIV